MPYEAEKQDFFFRITVLLQGKQIRETRQIKGTWGEIWEAGRADMLFPYGIRHITPTTIYTQQCEETEFLMFNFL